VHKDVFPEEVGLWLKRGAQIVDVREPWEYRQGHLPGAVNIPLGELAEHVGEIASPAVLVCASGNRSLKAAQYLDERGLAEVANLMGGTYGWAQRGQPLETEE
jgi:phage shock protein E